MYYELPETKQCQCGRDCPVVDAAPFVELPEGLRVGIAECKACNLAHYVAVGDHELLMEFYEVMAGESMPESLNA